MKVSSYIKICLTHWLIYYVLFAFLFQYINYWYCGWEITGLDFLGKVLTTPLLALLGYFDFFSVYAFCVFFIVFEKYLIKVPFKAYIASVTVVYLIIPFIMSIVTMNFENYILQFCANSKEEILKINELYLKLPTLFVTIFTIYIVTLKLK